MTALMMASSSDNDREDIVRSLLDKKMVDVNAKDTAKVSRK